MVDFRKTTASASRAIGLSFSRSSKTHTIDDELLEQFSKNAKAAILAFKFITAQSDRIAKKCWPRFFKSCKKVIVLFKDVLATDMLESKDLNQFYNQFDTMHTSSEAMTIHPKERNFGIVSIQLELDNYKTSIEHLEPQVVSLAQLHSDQLGKKITAMVERIEECRSNISYRNKLGKNVAKLEKKIRGMTDKNTSLDVQKRAELAGLEASLEITKSAYDSENSNLKLLLPEFLTLVEEFLETITRWTVSFHHSQIGEVQKALKYIEIFHGFNGTEISETEVKYSTIIDQWESDVTATRVKIESTLQVLYSRNKDRISEDISEKDDSLKASKLWSLMSQKISNRQHKIKTHDTKSGIFDDDMMADTLVSFAKYDNVHSNMNECYNPSRIVSIEEIIVSPKADQMPPQLPSRNTTHGITLSPKHNFQTPLFSSGFDKIYQAPISNSSLDSLTSVSSAELAISFVDDDDDSKSQLEFLEKLPASALEEHLTQRLVALYNGAKNEILECPVVPSRLEEATCDRDSLAGFQDYNSAASDMHELYSFFQKAMHLSEALKVEKSILVAKRSFKGQKPGDLAFSEGDEVQVIYDLQNDALTYRADGENWFIGSITGTNGICRIGFAPSTHFL